MIEDLSILLVEDDRHIALALQIRLRAAGYDVVLAASVAEAMSQFDKHALDVAVLDINLPDGDGIELMQQLLALNVGNPLICIIMTASRKPGLKEKALAKGAYAFLEKPFSSKVLLEAVAGEECQSKAS